ncbi:unnamed protein product, partial [Symbiodinium sp. CCMP2456]
LCGGSPAPWRPPGLWQLLAEGARQADWLGIPGRCDDVRTFLGGSPPSSRLPAAPRSA